MELTAPNPTRSPNRSTRSFVNKCKSEDELIAEFIEISPTMATEFLKHNKRNRPVRESRVGRYAELMKDDDWLPSPDAIAFDYNGNLINGQHRLKGIKQSGTTKTCLVAFNLPPDAIKIADVGIKRSPSDVLAIEGFKRPHELGATIRLVILWLNNQLDRCNEYSLVENYSIVNAAEQCTPRIQRSIDYVEGFKSGLLRVPFPRSLMMFGHFVYAPTYGRRADSFVKRLATGTNIQDWEDVYNEEGAVSPVKMLRDKMAQSARTTGKMGRVRKLSYMIQAMNWYCKEEQHNRLRYRESDNFNKPEVDLIPEYQDDVPFPKS